MQKLTLTLEEVRKHREVQLEKRAISWYSYRDALWDGNGYSGQEESGLKYLHLPENLDRVHFDLNWSHPDDHFQLQEYAQIENISDLLSWIKDLGNQDNWFAEAEFICQSHHFTGMLKMLYQPSDLFLQIEVFDGKIYMRRLPDQRDRNRVAEYAAAPDADRALRTKQGLKLDSYLLSRSASDKPNPARPVQRGQFGRRVVFKGAMGDHKLLYSSAFKCLDNAVDLKNLDKATFTASKTIKGSSSSSVRRHTWMDWWSLNTLGQVNRTLIACLPEWKNGIVTKLEIVNQSDMFRKLQNSRVSYYGIQDMPQEKVCFSCLDEILTFIKSATSGASDGDVFELKHYKVRPGVVEVSKVSDLPKPEVVPVWFKEWVSSNKPAKAE